MTSLSPEVRHARELLRRVSIAPEAEARVYWNVMAASRERKLLGLRVSTVTVGILLSASAALGFGLASRIEHRSRAVTPSASVVAAATAPKPHLRRQSPQRERTDEAMPLDVGASQERQMGEDDAVRHGRANPSPGTSTAATPRSATAPSELSQQVADYRDAVAQLAADPAGALVRLEAYRQRWPSSALLHEVDLRIIQGLVALGRHGEARREAERFLSRYPESARAAEVRRIAEKAQSDTDPVD